MIATLPEFARAVLGRGWVLGKKMSPEYTIEILEGSGSESLLVESKLFAVARGPEKFPDQISDFHPSLFNASERVIDFSDARTNRAESSERTLLDRLHNRSRPTPWPSAYG